MTTCLSNGSGGRIKVGLSCMVANEWNMQFSHLTRLLWASACSASGWMLTRLVHGRRKDEKAM